MKKIKDFGGICLWCEEKTALKTSFGYSNTCGDCLIKSYNKTSPQDLVWIKWGIKNGIDGGRLSYCDWIMAGSPRE